MPPTLSIGLPHPSADYCPNWLRLRSPKSDFVCLFVVLVLFFLGFGFVCLFWVVVSCFVKFFCFFLRQSVCSHKDASDYITPRFPFDNLNRSNREGTDLFCCFLPGTDAPSVQVRAASTLCCFHGLYQNS